MSTATVSRACQSVRGSFNASGYLELQRVTLSEFDEGCVRMEGIVHSYYLKQLAGALCQIAPGVVQIDNALEVE